MTEKSKDDEDLPTVSSPRMKLAMLMQVKGYIENLKGSIDSLKDEMLHKSKRDAADTEYPAYGVTGPCKDFSPAAADRKLAQSAHMFHYQHQKQQMIALEKSSGDERHCSTSDVDSEEGEEGDYTVYECPGLAPTDEMEVKNPLFSDDPTPATPGRQQKDEEEKKKKEGAEQDDDEDEEELENH
ncbi:UNVERIFIED_CONTAM: hypothetical protein RMT77_006703 [Armadillidium vulgare]